MIRFRDFFICAVATLLIFFASGALMSAHAEEGAALMESSNTQQTQALSALQTSNYCVSCHSSDDPNLANPTSWRGEIIRASITPCPAAKKIQEEIYYTERLLLAIDRFRAALPPDQRSSALESRISAAHQGYLRLLDAPVQSLDAFTSEAQTLRYKLGKIYNELNQQSETVKRNNALIFGIAISLIILASLSWGLYHTRYVRQSPKKPGLRGAVRTAIFLLIIVGFFTLPLLRQPTQQAVAADVEAQQIQTTLDTAQRNASIADQAMARAWMFSRVAALWHEIDSASSQEILQQALQAAEIAHENATALWGQAASAQEAAVGDPAALEKAGLIANRLTAVRSRAWNYRLIAEEWMPLDPSTAENILATAWQATQSAQGIYRDLDRRAIAVTWAKLDPQRGPMLLSQVEDPAIRAWGWREIAALTHEQQDFEKAAEAARQIADPARKAHSLAQIASAAHDAALLDEALSTLDSVTDVAQRAYLLAVIASYTGSDKAGMIIPNEYPGAQTLAWFHLGRFDEAWNASQKIADPFEKARAQSEIVIAWSRAEPQSASDAARQIEIPLLRDRTMRYVIQIAGNASLVEEVQNPYDRLLAMTYLGKIDLATALAAELKETYPLVELALAQIDANPAAALQLVDQIQREADRAVVLRALATQTGDSSIFKRALGMAMAARVRGDGLAPAMASLNLARDFLTSNLAWSQAALEQAYQITERISIK